MQHMSECYLKLEPSYLTPISSPVASFEYFLRVVVMVTRVVVMVTRVVVMVTRVGGGPGPLKSIKVHSKKVHSGKTWVKVDFNGPLKVDFKWT